MVEVRRCSRPPHRICQCWSTPAGERPVPSSAATLAQSLTPLFTSARSFVSSSSDHRGTFAPGARLRVWKRRCEMQSQNSADAAQCGVCPNLVEGGAERGRNLSQSGPVAGPVRRCERVQQGWHTVFSLAACHTLVPSPHPRSLPSPPQPVALRKTATLLGLYTREAKWTGERGLLRTARVPGEPDTLSTNEKCLPFFQIVPVILQGARATETASVRKA